MKVENEHLKTISGDDDSGIHDIDVQRVPGTPDLSLDSEQSPKSVLIFLLTQKWSFII